MAGLHSFRLLPWCCSAFHHWFVWMRSFPSTLVVCCLFVCFLQTPSQPKPPLAMLSQRVSSSASVLPRLAATSRTLADFCLLCIFGCWEDGKGVCFVFFPFFFFFFFLFLSGFLVCLRYEVGLTNARNLINRSRHSRPTQTCLQA